MKPQKIELPPNTEEDNDNPLLHEVLCDGGRFHSYVCREGKRFKDYLRDPETISIYEFEPSFDQLGRGERRYFMRQTIEGTIAIHRTKVLD